jgi:NAD(P)H dehydrogenase (quinone)
MSIVITGASGHYGRATADGLLKTVPAEDLILVTRNPDRLAAYAELGCQVRRGDFDEPGALPAAFAGGETMMLISTGRVGARVIQHEAAIQAAKAAGVRRIAYTSFINPVPGNPAIVTRDHAATEALLRQSGLAWTALRDSWYADALVQAAGPVALATGRWMSSSGEGRVGIVTREDCVDCAVAVLSGEGHDNRAYDITGPELVSVREAAAIISQIAGKPIEYVLVTDDDMYAHFDALGVPRHPIDDHVASGIPWCSDDMVSFERAIREGALAIVSEDVQRLTGHAPESFRRFAERHAEALRSVPGAPSA